MQEFPLSLALVDKEMILVAIHGSRGLRARLNSMGLNEGLQLKVLHAYGRGPRIIQIGGTRLALGHGMAQKIMVKEK